MNEQLKNLPDENIYAHTKKLQFFLEHVGRFAEERGRRVKLLDFGCGNGAAVSQFLAALNVEYYGVDLHQPSLNYAQHLFGSDHTHFSTSVPKDVQFDVQVYSDVLEHVDDPKGLLQANLEQLAPQGLVLASVPNGYGPFENEKRLCRWLGVDAALRAAIRLKRRVVGAAAAGATETVPYNAESGHVQFFTLRAFYQTLEAAGLQVVNQSNGAFVGAPVSDLLLGRSRLVVRMNAATADYVPSWAASSWMVAARRQKSEQA